MLESPPLPSPPDASPHRRAGFTLVELLVVVGVIVIMMSLAIPAFNSIRGGTDFTSEVYSVTSAMQEARAYAMANNTFVLVGIAEVNGSQSTAASPQVSGTGRIAIAVIASKDGTRPYQSLLNTAALTGTNWLTGGYKSGTAFTAISKLIVLTNIHLVDLQSATSSVPSTGGMVRPFPVDYPTTWPAKDYDISNTAECTAGNCFAWPLGSSVSGNPSPQFIFAEVIEFDPEGSARIIVGNPNGGQNTVPQDSIPYYIEIGLEPAFGATAPAAPADETKGQITAVQIDGMSGATRIYRP
jgi:prepilin-type N-terminal cleavage/methylation domain-containing protein